MSNHWLLCRVAARMILRWLGREARKRWAWKIYPGFSPASDRRLRRKRRSARAFRCRVMGIGADGQKSLIEPQAWNWLGKYVPVSRKRARLADQAGQCKVTTCRRLRPGRIASGLKEVWSRAGRDFLSMALVPALIRAGRFRTRTARRAASLPFPRPMASPSCRSATIVPPHINKNPYLAPYEEFQRYKAPFRHSSAIRRRQARRLWAPGRSRRAGLQSIPRLSSRVAV